MNKLKELAAFLNRAGLDIEAIKVAQLGMPFELASKKSFIDDMGRVFVLLKMMESNNVRIFYKSSGTGTPGMVSKGEWIPMNGMAFAGYPPDVYYIKDPGKKPPAGSEEERVINYLDKYGFGENSPTEFESLDVKFSHSKSYDDNLTNKSTFLNMVKFNEWAKGAGAIMNYGRFTVPGINIDYPSFKSLFAEYFP